MYLKRMLAAVLGGFLVFSGTIAGAAQRVVRVDAQGTVQVAPDEVLISVELKTVDDDLVRVRQNSDTQVRGILELAKKHGVKEGAFQVSELKLGLSYNDELRRQIYHIERSLQLRLSELANLNALLADLLKQPDASVGEIQFDSSKADKHRRAALEKAVERARTKATLLAGAVDLKLGKAVSLVTTDESYRPFVTSVVPVVAKKSATPVPPGLSGGGFFLLFAQAQEQPAAEGTFGLGMLEFSASVAAEFEMLDE